VLSAVMPLPVWASPAADDTFTGALIGLALCAAFADGNAAGDAAGGGGPMPAAGKGVRFAGMQPAGDGMSSGCCSTAFLWPVGIGRLPCGPAVLVTLAAPASAVTGLVLAVVAAAADDGRLVEAPVVLSVLVAIRL